MACRRARRPLALAAAAWACWGLCVAAPGALERYPPSASAVESLVDHFDPADDRTFTQRVLSYDAWWAPGGPILLYLGNEGPIPTFYNNTGAMFEHARALRAMVVFVEHRYYGASVPAGGADLRWLTIEQAMADYAVFVAGLRRRLSCGPGECPVVTFGGSYGGMLVVWFRQKYPQLTVGGVGGGAVIDFYPHDQRREAFWNATLHTFGSFGTAGCAGRVEASLATVAEFAKSERGRSALEHALGSCQPLANETTAGEKVDFYLRGVAASLAMLDYPEACDFVTPLPANPVAAACRILDEAAADALAGWRGVLDFYANATGGSRCYDFLAEVVGRPTRGTLVGPRAPPDMGNWQYQACTQLPMQVLSSDGLGFFPPSDGQLAAVAASCGLRYGVAPRPEWLPLSLGGSDLRVGGLFLTDGEKDPWRTGSVRVERLRPGVDVQHHVIPAAAHHEDLRFDAARPRPEVSRAKRMARDAMRRWIASAAASAGAAAAGGAGAAADVGRGGLVV